MTYEKIKEDSNVALKQGDKMRRLVLSDICASIEKASISAKSRSLITDELVDETLIKYKKTVQEMVDTCPKTEQYAAKLAEYQAKLAIVEEYAPKVISDYNEIMEYIDYWMVQDIHIPIDNKGNFIRSLMPECKAKHFDMKVANKVLNDLWNNFQKNKE